MGDIYVAPPPHVCQTPIRGARNILLNIANRHPGSIWQCDEEGCGKKYIAVETLVGPVWHEYSEGRNVDHS